MSKSQPSGSEQAAELQSKIHDRFTLFMDRNELMEYFSNIERFHDSSAYQRRYTRGKGKQKQIE